MNSLEREQLVRFLEELVRASATSKDVDADTLIREACQRQPDANYLLVQRSLLLDQALKNVEAQNAKLQQELARNGDNGESFLNDNAWGNSPARSSASQSAVGCAPSVQPASTQASSTSWGSGLLGTVATTAAGVVAGSFLFQGIEHLMGNHGNGSGLLDGQSSPLMTDSSTGNTVTEDRNDANSTTSDFDSLIPSDDELGSI